MRRYIIVALIAAIGVFAFSATVPVTAGAHHNQDIAKLNKKVRKLKKKVRGLEGTVYGCLRVVPVSSYGDTDGTFGYDFSNDGFSFFLTTALDFAFGGPVDVWVTVDRCRGKAKGDSGLKPTPVVRTSQPR